MRAQRFDFDATVVSRLKSGGGVLVAKLAMMELAGGFGVSHPESSFTGPGVNQWDTSRWSEGSSRGSGSAVGAGLVTFAIGSETWGSILHPSAACAGRRTGCRRSGPRPLSRGCRPGRARAVGTDSSLPRRSRGNWHRTGLAGRGVPSGCRGLSCARSSAGRRPGPRSRHRGGLHVPATVHRRRRGGARPPRESVPGLQVQLPARLAEVERRGFPVAPGFHGRPGGRGEHARPAGAERPPRFEVALALVRRVGQADGDVYQYRRGGAARLP